MPNLIEDLFDPQFYDAAITHSCIKDMPRKSLRQYCTAEFQLKLLQDLEDGVYKIQPPKIGYIPKDDGTLREIYINSNKDRFILSAVNAIWYARHSDMISSACKAYMPGASCANVVKEVALQKQIGYKVDLSKYFDSVSHEVINRYLEMLDTGTTLDKAIFEYYNDDYVYINKVKTARFKSLAQGCAVSAFLSNCVLKDIDDEMLRLCDYYCRYSDDMLLLGSNADKALSVLQTKLQEFGLALNPNKIEKLDGVSEFKFLGFGICGSRIRISVKDFVSRKQRIKRITSGIRKNKHLSSQEKLNRVVKRIMSEFICWTEPTHSWIYTKALAVNDIQRLRELDMFCKEHIRAAVTGKWNFTTNCNKVSEDMLRDAGYVSLVHIYKLATIDRDLFLQECLQWKQHLK